MIVVHGIIIIIIIMLKLARPASLTQKEKGKKAELHATTALYWAS